MTSRPTPALLALAAPLALLVIGCGSDVRRFPLRDPIWVDDDLRPVSYPCRPDPEGEEPGAQLCRPDEYVSPFGWDVGDKTIFRPLTRLFAVDPGGEAANVNAFDEVPDSSWFVNRIGLRPMTNDEIVRGSCGAKSIDAKASKPGDWLVDMGKPNGANPGFRVSIEGVGKFMLKADVAGEGEKATGATSIASRFYFAAGWYAPCDTVVYFDPALLKLKPGLKVTDNSGVSKPFDQKALEGVIAKAAKRDGLVRMIASGWLPGRTIGPFRYEDTREDDPNDVVPHEDRRDLRGARVISAWLGHYDSREQNTMTTWMAADKDKKDGSPGHTIHWYIDLGDCFGSKWQWDQMSRKLNHSYYLDLADMGTDAVTLGIPERPWDRAKLTPGAEMFNYFNGTDFEPDEWKGGYPNPAFQRMTELDAAWAARIVTRFDDEAIAKAITVADYTEPGHRAFLLDALIKRRDKIRQRYFAKLSPLADVVVRAGAAGGQGRRVCATDLASAAKTWPQDSFRYAAAMWTGEDLDRKTTVAVSRRDGGEVCLDLPPVAASESAPPDDPLRYAVVDVSNGVAPGPLRLHFYDQGAAKGHRLVGIERPAGDGAP
jgi:hypothetical protein